MIAHILSIVLLAGFAFETWRTVQNFGYRRHGMVGNIVDLPVAHMGMAGFIALVGLILPGRFSFVPGYVTYALLVIAAYYFVCAALYKRRRMAERSARKTAKK